MNTWSAAEWKTVSVWPSMGDKSVHVWLADLEGCRVHSERLLGMLSSDERERAARFRLVMHRERYQMARGLLRAMLARYLDVDATRLQIVQNEQGKPALSAPQITLFFNVSHSQNCAVFAFSRNCEVGIDVEKVRGAMPQQDEIAARYFAPGEWAELQQVSAEDRTTAFFRCWSRKEAIVKARGDGIFGGLQNFEVSVTGPARLLTINKLQNVIEEWSMSDLPPVAGFVGAVAARNPNCNFNFFRMSPGAVCGGKK